MSVQLLKRRFTVQVNKFKDRYKDQGLDWMAEVETLSGQAAAAGAPAASLGRWQTHPLLLFSCLGAHAVDGSCCLIPLSLVRVNLFSLQRHARPHHALCIDSHRVCAPSNVRCNLAVGAEF